MSVFTLIFLGLTAPSVTLTAELRNFTEANNRFAADIYRELSVTSTGNFVVCPISAEIVLALVHSASDGITAQEISNALQLPRRSTYIHRTYRELLPKIETNSSYSLGTVNKIYLPKDCSILERFRARTVGTFGSEIENIDFGQKGTVYKINKWVAGKTNKRVKQLIIDDSITNETQLILLNGIYFQGKWVNTFNKGVTKKQRFILANNRYKQIDMMQQINYFNYYYDSNLYAKFLELPYEGDNITMTIVLPDKLEGLAALEEHINDVIKLPEYSRRLVNLMMPKNKISTIIDFKPILNKLGIEEAFQPTANFKKMLSKSRDELYIDRIVQKALIETVEDGTVGAVGTAAVITGESTSQLGPADLEFNVNHPFIFFLKHRDFGVLFIGRCTSPNDNLDPRNRGLQEDR